MKPHRADVPGRARPKVSVVIPAFNEEATIERCLTALANQSVAPFEVLVVDNRSNDRTATRAATVAGDLVRVIHQDAEQGLVPTRNHGFDTATGDILARIDADTVVGPRWVEQLHHQFGTRSIAAVSGPVGYYDLPLPPLNRRMDDWGRRAVLAVGRRRPFLFGSNMALRRAAWIAIRSEVCRDVEDAFHEDIDLAIHLTRNRLAIGYAPRLTAAVSARSAAGSAAEFADYTRRFDRTLNAHGLDHVHLRLAGRVLRAAYPALHHGHRRFSARPPAVGG